MIVERILTRQRPFEPQGRLALSTNAAVDEKLIAAAFPPAVGCLLIEAGGVVYDDTCWWRWMVQVLTHTGIHTRYEDLLEKWEAEFLRHPDHGGVDFWKALRRCLMQFGLTAGCCDEVQAAANALHKQWEATLHAFPGADSALVDLSRRGVPLVALADAGCSGHRLADRLQTLSLAGCFQRTLSAADGGRSLADPGFYRQPLPDLSIAPRQVALVSSKPCHLAAAGQAGLTTVAVNCPPDVRADVCLDRLAALPGQLRYHHQPAAA